MNKRLTGKQQKFVTEYLNGANFNATVAAKLAGYQATSKHSFEAIGSENLTRPTIAAAIDEHFKQANVSAEECLIELDKLARGDSRDKIKALALLSTHHGLLDGSWHQRGGQDKIEILVKYESQKVIDQTISEIQKDVDEYNRQAAENNKRRDEQWEALIRKYEHSQITVEALRELRDVMFGKRKSRNRSPNQSKLRSFTPPTKRLPAAPIERMMAEVQEIEPVRKSEICRHGYITDRLRLMPRIPKRCRDQSRRLENLQPRARPLYHA